MEVVRSNLDCAPQAPLHPGYAGWNPASIRVDLKPTPLYRMRSSYRWTSSWYLRWLLVSPDFLGSAFVHLSAVNLTLTTG